MSYMRIYIKNRFFKGQHKSSIRVYDKNLQRKVGYGGFKVQPSDRSRPHCC